MTCLQKHLKEKCGCTDRLVLSADEPRCSVVNKTQGGQFMAVCLHNKHKTKSMKYIPNSSENSSIIPEYLKILETNVGLILVRK